MRVSLPISFSPVGRGLAVLVLTALSACSPALAQSPPHPAPVHETPEGGTLQVSGQAQVQIPAERVTISFSMETESPSAREASALNAERMEEVLEALRRVGGEDTEVETFGYTLTPEYRRPTQNNPAGQTISGYRVRNNIRATLDEVEKAGELLDAAISAGANRVLGLAFSAKDIRPARMEALRVAVVRAKEEAQTMADAMGVRLGPALEVRSGGSQGGPIIAYRNVAAEMASVRTPIEASEQTVSASVTIIYRILEMGH
jgi:uncharacterized protein YggE